MAHIDCVIDTNPMAQEMASVSHNITGTTAAVVAMKAAVVKAEGDAADHVCENVNQGFYALIHSQISQKTAKLQSEVESHLMKLNMLRRQLQAIKGRMERDYGMISSRYLKLFSGLDRELELRIYELDRPVMELAMKETGAVSNRKKITLATVPVSQVESLRTSQKIIASNIKSRSKSVIDSMTRFLTDMEEQNALTGRILLPQTSGQDEAELLLPVIISEACYDKSGDTQAEAYVSPTGISSATQDAVFAGIKSALPTLNWQESAPSEEVKSEFHRLMSSSSAPKRVKEMMERLFSAANCQTLKGNEA